MNTLKQIITNLFLSAIFFLMGIVAVVCAIAYLDITHDEPSPKVYIILLLILGIWVACFKEAINILRFITLSWNERKIEEKNSLFWTVFLIGLFWNKKDS